MQIIYKSNSWYLWGYCRDRQDFRTFRLSRIKNLSPTNINFDRREIDRNRLKDDQDRPKTFITLKMWFSNKVIHRVYDDFNDDLIIKNPDGSCLVSVVLVEDEWVYGFILSYGCDVEVLEPEHIKRIIAIRLKKAIQIYEK